MCVAKEAVKEAVSVSEMAEMVGLSRSRFNQLIGDTFPPPVYDVATRRPFYTRELQDICLDVRLRNCGINGKPAIFYAKRTNRIKATVRDKPDDLVKSLRSMGLSNVTPEQVGKAMNVLYPQGAKGVERNELLRELFVSIHPPEPNR
jgi:hypothetical protein